MIDPYNRVALPAGWEHPLKQTIRGFRDWPRNFDAVAFPPPSPKPPAPGEDNTYDPRLRCFIVKGARVHCSTPGCVSASGTTTWCVWHPAGLPVTDADIGDCPKCGGWHQNPKRGKRRIPWHEMNDEHLLNVARYISRRMDPASPGSVRRFLPGGRRWFMSSKPLVQDLRHALAEMRFRDLLPTCDDLRVAFDLCNSRGTAHEDGKPLPLLHIWAQVALELRTHGLQQSTPRSNEIGTHRDRVPRQALLSRDGRKPA